MSSPVQNNSPPKNPYEIFAESAKTLLTSKRSFHVNYPQECSPFYAFIEKCIFLYRQRIPKERLIEILKHNGIEDPDLIYILKSKYSLPLWNKHVIKHRGCIILK